MSLGTVVFIAVFVGMVVVLSKVLSKKSTRPAGLPGGGGVDSSAPGDNRPEGVLPRHGGPAQQ